MHDRIANCGHAPHLRTKGFASGSLHALANKWPCPSTTFCIVPKVAACDGRSMSSRTTHSLARSRRSGSRSPRRHQPAPRQSSASSPYSVTRTPRRNPRARARSVVSWCTCRRTDSPSAHSERRPQGRYERMRVGADGGRRAVLLTGLAPSTDQIPQPPSLRMCGPAEAPRSTRRYG